MTDMLDPRIVDHYDDKGLLLKRAFANREIPALVRSAVDMSSSAHRHPGDYALVVKTASVTVMKFPLVDAGNAAASAIYFAEHGEYLPPELQKEAAGKLQAALKSFGLPVPEEFTKTAALELGFSSEGEDIMMRELFGLNSDGTDPDGIFEEIHDEFDGLSPRGKRRFAMQVKTAGISMDDVPGMGNYVNEDMGPNVPIALEARKLLTGWGTEETELLDGLKQKVARAQIEPEALVAALSAFDTEHGLTSQYGKLCPDPYASVYGNLIEKTASVETVDIGGREFASDAIVGFSQRSGDQLTDKFGEEFAAQFASDPVAVLGSLPDPHKAVIAGMMDAD